MTYGAFGCALVNDPSHLARLGSITDLPLFVYNPDRLDPWYLTGNIMDGLLQLVLFVLKHVDTGGELHGLGHVLHGDQDLIVQLPFLNTYIVPGIDYHEEHQRHPDKDQKLESEATVIGLQNLVLLPVCIKSSQHGRHTPCTPVFWQWDPMRHSSGG